MVENSKKSVDKRGFIDGFSLVVFLIVVGSIGGVTYLIAQPGSTDLSNYYVGDATSKIVYDYECLDNIPETQRILFGSLEIAENLDYNFMEDCPK